MKKMTMGLLLVVGLAGCAESKKDDKHNKARGGGNEEQVLENKTDYSMCGQGTYTPAKTPEGAWMMLQTSEDFRLTTVFYIDRNSVSVTNSCEMGRLSLTVQASVPAAYDARTLTTYGEAHDEQEINDGGSHLNCEVSISKARLYYALKGNCLVLTAPGQQGELVLIPTWN